PRGAPAPIPNKPAAESHGHRPNHEIGVPGSSGVNPSRRPRGLVTTPSTPHSYRPLTTGRSDLMSSVSDHRFGTEDLQALAKQASHLAGQVRAAQDRLRTVGDQPTRRAGWRLESAAGAIDQAAGEIAATAD